MEETVGLDEHPATRLARTKETAVAANRLTTGSLRRKTSLGKGQNARPQSADVGNPEFVATRPEITTNLCDGFRRLSGTNKCENVASVPSLRSGRRFVARGSAAGWLCPTLDRVGGRLPKCGGDYEGAQRGRGRGRKGVLEADAGGTLGPDPADWGRSERTHPTPSSAGHSRLASTSGGTECPCGHEDHSQCAAEHNGEFRRR